MTTTKVSEYTILLEPKESISNDKTVYADLEIDLIELLEELERELPSKGCDCHPEMSKLLKVLQAQEKRDQ